MSDMSSNEAIRRFLDTQAAPAPADGDKVELNWSIEVTENWSTTIGVDDLVDAINETLHPDYDEDATPVTADGVRAALKAGEFVARFGRVLARDNLGAGDMGGILPDWEDTDAPNTSVSSNVTERYLDTAKLAEEGKP